MGNQRLTYKQAKDKSKRSGSAPQTSAYFDQVLGTKDGISLHNITQVGLKEELLLPDWDKNEPPENNFNNELVPINNQQNMENKSGNMLPCLLMGIHTKQ